MGSMYSTDEDTQIPIKQGGICYTGLDAAAGKHMGRKMEEGLVLTEEEWGEVRGSFSE